MSLLFNVDVDGVIYPFTTAIRRAAAIRLHDPTLVEAPPSQSWSLAETFGITDDEWHELFEWATLHGVFNHSNLKPYPDAVAGMAMLRERGHHLRLVTAKPIFSGHKTHAISDMVSWLRDKGIEYDELVVTTDKSQYPCDIAIDDKPSTDWMTGDINLLFDQPWNHGWRPLGVQYERAYGWVDVLSYHLQLMESA